MVKQIIEKNENVLPNSREMDVLKQNFPSCFNVDGSFDIERFKEFLKDKVNVTKEGYELKFLGKNYARLLASVDTTTVIVPDEENNNKPENKDSENIYITGDNLDALKHLLQSYAGKVKCIYIDPPYNTGSDGFVYNDSFNFTAEDLAVKLSIDEEQAKRILDLTKRGSASHSAWLMFMYPRLLLARDLLSDDGVIFISIDDNEQSNLKLLCDDVFGEQNCISNMVVVRSEGGGMAKQVVKGHDYLLVYARDIDNFIPLGREKDIRGKIIEKDGVKYWIQEDWLRIEFGKYGNCFYEDVEKYKGKEKLNEINEGLKTGEYVLINKGNNKHIVGKLRNIEEDTSKFYSILKHLSAGGIHDLDQIGLKNIFDYPKPVSLITEVVNGVHLEEKEKFIVLDFFSGSATTAHAVMQLNAEEKQSLELSIQNLDKNDTSYNSKIQVLKSQLSQVGHRKFIMVQLPEQVKADSEAEKAGYKTIDQIGRERIRRDKDGAPRYNGGFGI